MLENSGAEIRVTVWESDLNKVKNIGIKILHNTQKIFTERKHIISTFTCFK